MKISTVEPNPGILNLRATVAPGNFVAKLDTSVVRNLPSKQNKGEITPFASNKEQDETKL